MDIDGYEKIADLGKGGMAFVYKSRHKDLDRVVALKVMDKKFNFDVSFTQRFQREAKISAKLAHKHIVQIYDVGVFNGSNYLSMEYVPGGDLSDLLEQNKHLTEGTIVECIKQMASALDFAASKHVVHRDVKPANILIRGDNDFVLADFGIAKNDDTFICEYRLKTKNEGFKWVLARGKSFVNDKKLAYSLGVIFSKSLAEYLAIEEAELGFGIKKYSGYQTIFIYDTAKGGAGYASQFRLYADKILKLALDVLQNCSCQTACTKTYIIIMVSGWPFF